VRMIRSQEILTPSRSLTTRDRRSSRDLGVVLDDLQRGSVSQKDSERDAIYSILDQNNTNIKLVYRWYMAHSMYRTERPVFHLSPNQFRMLLKHSKCSPEVCNELGLILKAVMAHAPKTSTGRETSEGIDLRGLVEALLRVADVQYRSGGVSSSPERRRGEGALYERISKFFQHNMPLLHQFRSDGFRESVFWHPDVQGLLRAYKVVLENCYNRRAMRARVQYSVTDTRRQSQGSQPEQNMSIGDFFASMKDLKLFDTTLSVARLTHIFFKSNFEEDQGIGWDDWDWEMTFTEYSEALTRIAVVLVCRTFEDLDELFRNVSTDAAVDAVSTFLEGLPQALKHPMSGSARVWG